MDKSKFKVLKEEVMPIVCKECREKNIELLEYGGGKFCNHFPSRSFKEEPEKW